MRFKFDTFFFVVAEGSSPHKFLEQKKYPFFIVVSRNPICRIFFEFFFSGFYLKKNKIDIIYSYFGFGIYPKKYIQVSGSVDSNLYFPEIDFWNNYQGINRIKKYLIDRFRIFGIKRANAVIYENEIMLERALNLFGVKEKKLIKPSITFSEKMNNGSFSYLKQDPTGVFLCGWQLNKNILKIPEIAAELKKNNFKFHFILTAPKDNSFLHKYFVILLKRYDVESMVTISGQIQKEQLSSLFGYVDIVFLLSKLESFSNNIIEAWHYRKLLMIADEPWANSICKNGALYVKRDDIKNITYSIMSILTNKDLYHNIIQKGIFLSHEYPNIKQRINEEMEYLKYVYENN